MIHKTSNLLIGYQLSTRLVDSILRNRARIAEVYFPWGNFTSGRGVVPNAEAQRTMEADLARFSEAGIGMNLLLNGNCYGRRAQSRVFFQSVGDSVDELTNRFHLASVTTTSPLVAKFLKRNFPSLEVRASVNMEIGTPTGMEYVAEFFDGFYLKREFNRDFARIREVRRWCDEHGKKLYLLANSGCLNFCSARTFHDNLVAHEHEIAEMDNAFDFRGICHDFLSKESNRKKFLTISNFVRPEDLSEYEPFFDGIKIATRTNRNPAVVVEAYASGHFSGNVLELTEPSHAENFYPWILENARFPGNFSETVRNCTRDCTACGYCEKVLEAVKVRIDGE